MSNIWLRIFFFIISILIFFHSRSEAFETDKVIIRKHEAVDNYEVPKASSGLILYTAPSSEHPNIPGLYATNKDGTFEIALNEESIQKLPKCPNPNIVTPHPRALNSMLMYKNRVYLWLTNPKSCVPWMAGPFEQRPNYMNLYPNLTSFNDTSCQNVHWTQKGEFLWRCKMDLPNAIAKDGSCDNLPQDLFIGNWVMGFIHDPALGNYHLLHKIFPIGTPMEVEKYTIYNYGSNPLDLLNNGDVVGTMRLLSGPTSNMEWYDLYRLSFLERKELREIWVAFSVVRNINEDQGNIWYNYLLHRSSEILRKNYDFMYSFDLGRFTKVGQNFQFWQNKIDYPECYYTYNTDSSNIPVPALVCEDSADVSLLPPKRHAIKNTDPVQYHEEGYGKRTDGRSYIFVPIFSRDKTIHDCDDSD